jgi:hypothetical protein
MDFAVAIIRTVSAVSERLSVASTAVSKTATE